MNKGKTYIPIVFNLYYLKEYLLIKGDNYEKY